MILRLLTSLIILLLMCFTDAVSQQFDWVQHAGSQGENVARSIATDAAGNSFITGYFNKSIKLGDKVLYNDAGPSSAFIAKFDPAGNLLWAKNGVGSFSRGYTVATDKDGNSYMAGYVFDYITFGDKTIGIEINSDLFVAKYSSTGALLWLTTDLASYDFGRDLDLKVDAAGNCYVAGGIISGGLGSGSTHYNASYVGGYIFKLNSEGKQVYRAGLGNITVYNLALNKTGDRFYILGSLVNTGYIDAHRPVSAGMTDIVLAGYNASSGKVEWLEKIGGGNEELATGIAVDAQSNVYVAGTLSGDVTIQDKTIQAKGGTDIFIAKFSGEGVITWAQNAGSVTNDYVTDITLDKLGNPYITGVFSGTAIFDETAYTAASGQGNIYLAGYTPSGALSSFGFLGGTGKQESKHITIDKDNSIFIAGTMAGLVKFGESEVEANQDELFLAKIKADNLLKQPVPADPDVRTNNLILPNIITPNGDGLNDMFKVSAPAAEGMQKQFTVFNRYGKPVYTNSNYSDNWSASGLADGSYFYILTILGRDEVNTFKGWVEVLR